VNGLIIATSSRFAEIAKIIPPGFPTVFFDYKPPDFKNFDRVTCLSRNATYEAVCDMLDKGCKRIGAAFYDRNNKSTMREREEAYFDALKDHHLDYGKECLVYCNELPAPSRTPSFYPSFERLIELGCDAILTPGQPVTEQFINFKQQYSAARDIVFTGFYEYAWRERTYPNIGLVHQPVERIGQEVAELIISRVEEGYMSAPVREVILQSVYVPAQQKKGGSQ
jgi:DNA-binding LacI/PurR family transcriptional regulator